ncbi:MAG: MFS transporter, partial [Bacteroidales bacterium]|nr:MFS transporter [Bacteroidales bacterium]
TIYGIALEDIGDDAKIGASGLIMAILGGAIITPLQGKVSDMFDINTSYLVPLVCFVIVFAYSLYGCRKSARNG